MLGVMKPCEGGDPIALTKPKLLIGRRSFCDITLRYANVSSRHCELQFKDGFWYARDLESTNGTFIDGKVCQSEFVKPGSILSIGRHRFSFDYTAEGEPSPEPSFDNEVLAEGLLKKSGIELDSAPKAESSRVKPARPKHGGQLFPLGGGTPIALLHDHLVVGRNRDCEIRLPLKTISSRHCELEYIDGFWLVRDLGSHNGTKVNGKKVDQKWLLPNDELQLSTLRFKVLYWREPGAPNPKDIGVSFTRSLLSRAGLKRRR